MLSSAVHGGNDLASSLADEVATPSTLPGVTVHEGLDDVLVAKKSLTTLDDTREGVTNWVVRLLIIGVILLEIALSEDGGVLTHLTVNDLQDLTGFNNRPARRRVSISRTFFTVLSLIAVLLVSSGSSLLLSPP